MSFIAPFLVISLLTITILVVVTWHHRKTIARRQAAWQHFARMHEGTFRPGARSWWSVGSDTVEYDVGAARVLIDTYTVSDGDSSVTYTRARVQAPLAAGSPFKVYRQGFFSGIGKALGAQDVVIGRDQAFDDIFMVKADVPGYVRRVWTDRAMEIMRIHFQPARIESDGQEISISVRDHQTDPQILGLMGRVVADLGRAELLGLAAFEALPDAQVARPHGPWNARHPPVAAIPIGPAIVTITPGIITSASLFQGRRCVTTARVNGTRTDQDLQVMIGPDCAPETIDQLPVPTKAKDHLRAAGVGQLALKDGQARFTWLDIETNPDRLMAAAHALAVFTQAPSEGVFR